MAFLPFSFNDLLASLIIHIRTRANLVSYLFYVFVHSFPTTLTWFLHGLHGYLPISSFHDDYDDDAAFYTRVAGIDRNAHGISMEQQQVKACGVWLRGGEHGEVENCRRACLVNSIGVSLNSHPPKLVSISMPVRMWLKDSSLTSLLIFRSSFLPSREGRMMGPRMRILGLLGGQLIREFNSISRFLRWLKIHGWSSKKRTKKKKLRKLNYEYWNIYWNSDENSLILLLVRKMKKKKKKESRTDRIF